MDTSTTWSEMYHTVDFNAVNFGGRRFGEA
jgi:hypothetical protein